MPNKANELVERCEPGTPLPWRYMTGRIEAFTDGEPGIVVRRKVAEILIGYMGSKERDANARYIVTACNAYPGLLDRIAALEAELARAKEREAKMRSSIAAIAAERERQVSEKGWTPEHDDAQDGGELAKAAACYAMGTDLRLPERPFPAIWPWHAHWWKPGTDRIRQLVKAGALIAAEIERLHRATLQDTPS